MGKIYILNENGDVSFFKTLQGATSFVERIDVKNGEYELFDSNGVLIKLKSVKYNNKEEVVATSTDFKDEESLYMTLLDLCKYLKEHKNFSNKMFHIDCERKSLKQLIKVLTGLIGFED